MDKKPFDHIENKIREAADNSSQYPYEEQSWNSMEALLDKDKKRPFAWWAFALPLVMLIGGATYWYSNKQLATDDRRQTTVSATSLTTNNGQPSTNKTAGATTSNTTSTNNTVTGTDAIAYNADVTTIDNTDRSIQRHTNYRHTSGKTRAHIIAASSADDNNDIAQASSFTPIPSLDQKVSKVIMSDDSTSTVAVTSTVKKPSIKKDTTAAIAKTDDVKKKNTYKFYLLGMAGVDAADVNFMSFKNSSVTARVGVGIGYRLNKRFSIQIGFYEGRKKYIAGPGDYKAAEGTYYSTVDISRVSANCLVYDIPVTLRYDFMQRANADFYASIGISSFIMKNEAYDYNYTDAGLPLESSKTYTGNQSLFSILDLSIGGEKKLNDRFSLLLEPSVSIPLAGVGAGSVKLFSTSLLFGVKYNF